MKLYEKFRYSTFIRIILSFIPDKLFLQLMYRRRMHKYLNLKSPKTFNEKLNWLKLYDRRPEYTIYVDKYKVREYIAKTIGEKYLIPLLGVWNNPDEIDFDKLPNQFVLKCNHDQGSLCVCKDKTTYDIESAKQQLKTSLKKNYFVESREWPYKNVEKKNPNVEYHYWTYTLRKPQF